MIYLLTCLKPRAETTDTIIYYAAYDKIILEELLLSIYNEIMSMKNEYEISENVIKEYLKQFQILEVPILV